MANDIMTGAKNKRPGIIFFNIITIPTIRGNTISAWIYFPLHPSRKTLSKTVLNYLKLFVIFLLFFILYYFINTVYEIKIFINIK